MNLEEKIEERNEFCFLDLDLEIENENTKFSIQEEHHPMYDSWEANFNLSCAQFENYDYSEIKGEHEDLIQFEKIVEKYQTIQTMYIKPQQQCLRQRDRNHHFTSYLYYVDCFHEAEFHEERNLQASKERHLQQEESWMIHFISEDHEVIDEQRNMALHFPTKVHQHFTIATSLWRHDHLTKEEFLQGIDVESEILDVVDDKEKDEIILRLETPYPIKEHNILEQIKVDLIESWFQSIVGQAIQLDFKHILFSVITIYFGHVFDHLIVASTYYPI
jgi:hypothetical protein